MTFKKEYILEARNTGKLFGKSIFKIRLSDESMDYNHIVNCEVELSDEIPELKKYDKFKVIVEKL